MTWVPPYFAEVRPKMKHRHPWVPKIVGCFIGSLLLSLGVQLAWTSSYGPWHRQIAWHWHHVAPGWVIRTGHVTDLQPPDYANDPPNIKATVSFTDYFGRQEPVTATLPYRTRVGDAVEVDASRRGDVYIRQSSDYSGDWVAYPDPRAAIGSPGLYLVLFSFGAMVVAIAAGILFARLVGALPAPPALRGRLGSR